MPRLDQARLEFDSRHCGHMDVSDQAAGLVETAGCEKSGCRTESFDAAVQHDAEDGRQMRRAFPRQGWGGVAGPLLKAALIAKPNRG
jgi:hypothetical protein